MTDSQYGSIEQIAALVDDEITPLERTTLLARVAADPQSAALLTWLQRVIGLMRTDTGFDAPASVRRRAAQLFIDRTPISGPPTRRPIVAALRFDSRTQPMAFGMRSGAASTRQMLFNAGERDIDLRVSANGERFVVAGQILGPEEPGTVVLRGDAASAEARLNELAEFMLPPVPAGNYKLVLVLESAEIAIDELDVGT